MKKIAVTLVALLVVLFALYMTVGYFVYDKLSKVTAGGGENSENIPSNFVNRVDEWAAFDVSPYFMPEFEVIHFSSRQDGLTLTGWFVANPADAPAVILTHGLNGCKCSSRVLTIAGMLHRNGFNVLMYDMRDHGESDVEDGRAAIGNEEYQDLLGAWDWLINEKHFSPESIGVFGESLGAGTTLIAFGQEPRLAAAFVDSPYSDLPQIIDEELARNHYPLFLAPGGIFMARIIAGDNLISFSPRDAILHDAGRPIYIVHGTGDTRIGVHHTRQLAELAQQTDANVEVWIPDDIGHVEAVFALPDEYEQRLVAFFRESLDGFQE
ncbi:MAG TPA: alpha/beta fold hydrolase [Anaerolineales bacterium]|nr:alpha/beta fold hydrolase [Anaerolineales bacterium]